jgi:hypothetical protein
MMPGRVRLALSISTALRMIFWPICVTVISMAASRLMRGTDGRRQLEGTKFRGTNCHGTEKLIPGQSATVTARVKDWDRHGPGHAGSFKLGLRPGVRVGGTVWPPRGRAAAQPAPPGPAGVCRPRSRCSSRPDKRRRLLTRMSEPDSRARGRMEKIIVTFLPE